MAHAARQILAKLPGLTQRARDVQQTVLDLDRFGAAFVAMLWRACALLALRCYRTLSPREGAHLDRTCVACKVVDRLGLVMARAGMGEGHRLLGAGRGAHKSRRIPGAGAAQRGTGGGDGFGLPLPLSVFFVPSMPSSRVERLALQAESGRRVAHRCLRMCQRLQPLRVQYLLAIGATCDMGGLAVGSAPALGKEGCAGTSTPSSAEWLGGKVLRITGGRPHWLRRVARAARSGDDDASGGRPECRRRRWSLGATNGSALSTAVGCLPRGDLSATRPSLLVLCSDFVRRRIGAPRHTAFPFPGGDFAVTPRPSASERSTRLSPFRGGPPLLLGQDSQIIRLQWATSARDCCAGRATHAALFCHDHPIGARVALRWCLMLPACASMTHRVVAGRPTRTQRSCCESACFPSLDAHRLNAPPPHPEARCHCCAR